MNTRKMAAGMTDGKQSKVENKQTYLPCTTYLSNKCVIPKKVVLRLAHMAKKQPTKIV